METTKRNQYPTVEITISYSRTVKNSDRPCITSSRQAYEIILNHWNPETLHLYEEFKVMYLNRANRVIGIYEASRGGICGTVADPRLILGVAVKVCATAMILAHNHPSGNLQPSRCDELITAKLKQAGSFLEIVTTDHLIISDDGYYSFADEGRI
ncbi:MAG TPA: JAB domain-containing protein [Sediminibacterium sp.]